MSCMKVDSLFLNKLNVLVCIIYNVEVREWEASAGTGTTLEVATFQEDTNFKFSSVREL